VAKFTLLQMTQNVLSGLSSDEINSISDTTESLQVAQIIQNKYYDILTRGNLPDDNQLIQLTPSGNPIQPTLMFIPSGTSSLKWVNYFDSNPQDGNSGQSTQFGAYSHGVNTDLTNNLPWSTTSTTSNSIGLGTKTFTVGSGLTALFGQGVIATSGANSMLGTVTSYSGTTLVINVTSIIGSGTYTSWFISQNTGFNPPPGYLKVAVIGIQDFFDVINRFDPTASNVGSYTLTDNGLNYTIYYKNNHQPTLCTVLQNNYVLFDMYDNSQDSTLQGAKTMCFGNVFPVFTQSDGFIPVLDDNQFPLLINESKALAFYELKQMPHAKAEQEIKRQWSTVQKNKSISGKPSYFDQLPSFGRMPRTGGYGGFIYGPKLYN
jgi:hypothetical protein